MDINKPILHPSKNKPILRVHQMKIHCFIVPPYSIIDQ